MVVMVAREGPLEVDEDSGRDGDESAGRDVLREGDENFGGDDCGMILSLL